MEMRLDYEVTPLQFGQKFGYVLLTPAQKKLGRAFAVAPQASYF